MGELSPVLDRLAGDRPRLHAALCLSDEELIGALGGRRRAELRERHAAFADDAAGRPSAVASLCRHDARYPRALSRTGGSPHMLDVAGGAERLARLASGPVVALLGSERASDYGRALARSLACDLTASGVAVASGLRDGVAAAAHAGAQDAGGGSIAAVGGGLGVPRPGRSEALFRRLTRTGCAVSELPRESAGRRWGAAAAARIVVALASLVVVVEAHEHARELACAETARELGRPLAALPGRVTSPLSAGPHALLLDGASPIRSAEDVLELLARDPGAPPRQPPSAPRASRRHRAPRAHCERGVALAPHLHTILDLVGSGADTPDRLLAAGAEPNGLLLALTELELRGLLARGENGRYLPRRASLPGATRG